VQSFGDNLDGLPSLQTVTVPDLWQQQAVAALRAGRDVVVQAPTGSGKTLIFELWSNNGKNRGQAIYTVPTRALANDKLAEWRARGWNVGIATGDLSDNLDAPVLVATLETQKNRLIRGDGPALLVVDEYQMLGDDDRGLNYELAMALAPARTQLLLLSGSVANPDHVVSWLERLGRKAVLVRHETRPIPLEEVFASELSWHLPREIRSYWPRICAKGLAENLGPILLFAPRRQHAEQIAAELARELPIPNPLQLTPEQRQLVGESLAKLLKARVAYHHSGLSYAVRAGVIEPLAKAGQLRVVVATMGLAAGINFSLRTVAITATNYKRDGIEIPLRADEILQMFGRAGRRGLDDCGFVLVTDNELRMREGRSRFLARSAMVDWSALLGIMVAAAEQGKSPFVEAVRVQERLFTTKPIFLGVEQSLKHPVAPCGLQTDAERARHVRRRARELYSSRGEWERYPELTECRVGEIRVMNVPRKPIVKQQAADGATAELRAVHDHQVAPHPKVLPLPPDIRLKSILTEPEALERLGHGELVILAENGRGETYGRSMTVGDKLGNGQIVLAKWIRRLTNWNGRQVERRVWDEQVVPLIERELLRMRLPRVRFVEEPQRMVVHLSLAEQTLRVPMDSLGVPLWRPAERDVLPEDCGRCDWIESCKQLSPGTGTALLWRRVGLVDAAGVPTRRGRVTSFYSAGDGLAVAAALEDDGYALDDLLYDLANLDAGFRFCGEENRWGGRLAQACQRCYGQLNVTGYLEHGVPPKYGAGAELIVRAVHKDPHAKYRFVTDVLGDGDIDRVIIEWRSLLRQTSQAPRFDWPRWTTFQQLARSVLNETESPTMQELPPLAQHQTRRVDHRLILRRH